MMGTVLFEQQAQRVDHILFLLIIEYSSESHNRVNDHPVIPIGEQV